MARFEVIGPSPTRVRSFIVNSGGYCAPRWHLAATLRDDVHLHEHHGRPTLLTASFGLVVVPLAVTRRLLVSSRGRHRCFQLGKRQLVPRLCSQSETPRDASYPSSTFSHPSGATSGTWLPPYCGAVSLQRADILVIGVVHRDGGISCSAVRQLIDRFEPEACFIELDRERLTQLICDQRKLPWPVEVTVKPRQEETRFIRVFLGQVLGLVGVILSMAFRATGLTDQFGTEFFEAYRAAEMRNALLVPVDVSTASMASGFGKALRMCMSDPWNQVRTGIEAMCACVGGFLERPTLPGKPNTAWCVALPQALAAEGGGRLGPFVRTAFVGFATILAVMSVFDFVDPTPETWDIMDLPGQEMTTVPRFDVDFITNSMLPFMPFIVLAVLSSFANFVIRDRDAAMTNRISETIRVVEQLQPRRGSCEGVTPLGRPRWLRWLKRTWLGESVPGAPGQSDQVKAFEQVQLKQAGSPECHRLPVEFGLRSSFLSGARGVMELDASRDCLPLLEVQRPVGKDEVRVLLLSEPRFIDLCDSLEAGGLEAAKLCFGVVTCTPACSERPVSVESVPVAGQHQSLIVEMDYVLEEFGRWVHVQSVWQGVDERGDRCWHVQVRGSAHEFSIRERSLVSDDVGVLWVVPRAADVLSSSCLPSVDDHSQAQRLSGRRPRYAVVVGLFHVNGVVSGLHKLMRQEEPQKKR